MAADVHLAHVENGDVEVEEGLLADVDAFAAEFAGEGVLIQQESGQWPNSSLICWRRGLIPCRGGR